MLVQGIKSRPQYSGLLPDTYAINHVFIADGEGARAYVEKYGHSNVRTMHAHVEINPAARDAWLNCMGIAIDRVGLPAKTKVQMMEHFTRVAQMLVNRS